MKKLTVILFVMIFVCVAVSLSSCSVLNTESEIKYKDVDGGVALTRYKGSTSNDTLVIPAEYEGKPVVELTDFSVAASETLKHVTIGKNVKVISERAFCGSSKLVNFFVEEGNEFFEVANGVLYNKGKTELVCYPNGRVDENGSPITSFTIPDSVKIIRSSACYSCSDLKEVLFGSGITEVRANAFMKCTALEKLTLNEGLAVIGEDGFSFCDSLAELILPSTITKIGNYAFFSQASGIKRFITKKPVSEIECGENWLPTKNGLQSGVITPTYEA